MTLLRPAGCDGDDCDEEYGRWVCRPGCTSLADDAEQAVSDWPAEYLDGWTRRLPHTNRRPAARCEAVTAS